MTRRLTLLRLGRWYGRRDRFVARGDPGRTVQPPDMLLVSRRELCVPVYASRVPISSDPLSGEAVSPTRQGGVHALAKNPWPNTTIYYSYVYTSTLDFCLMHMSILARCTHNPWQENPKITEKPKNHGLY